MTTATRRPSPVQVSPSVRLLAQLADLRRWWGEGTNANVIRQAIAEAWYREGEKQAKVTQSPTEGE